MRFTLQEELSITSNECYQSFEGLAALFGRNRGFGEIKTLLGEH